MKPINSPLNEKTSDKILMDDVFGADGIVVGVFVTDWDKLPMGLARKIEELSKKRNDGTDIQAVYVKIFSALTDKYDIPDDTTTVVLYNNREEIARSVGPSTTEEIFPWLKGELKLIPLKPGEKKTQPGKKGQALKLAS